MSCLTFVEILIPSAFSTEFVTGLELALDGAYEPCHARSPRSVEDSAWDASLKERGLRRHMSCRAATLLHVSFLQMLIPESRATHAVPRGRRPGAPLPAFVVVRARVPEPCCVPAYNEVSYERGVIPTLHYDIDPGSMKFHERAPWPRFPHAASPILWPI